MGPMGSDSNIILMYMLYESTSLLSSLVGTPSLASDCIGHHQLRDLSFTNLARLSSLLFLAIHYTHRLEIVFGSYNGLWSK